MGRRWINHGFRESFAKIGTIHRLRSIMSAAPWSNHDLLVSFILLFIGLALLIDPAVGLLLRSYAYLNQRWRVYNVALLFAGVGALSLCVTLWCVSPPFWLRLLSRMASAFCLLLLAFSTAMFSPWTPASITYSLIGLWSFWGILRTNPSGR